MITKNKIENKLNDVEWYEGYARGFENGYNQGINLAIQLLKDVKDKITEYHERINHARKTNNI